MSFQMEMSEAACSEDGPATAEVLAWAQNQWSLVHVFMAPWWQEEADIKGSAVVEVEESQGSTGSRADYRVREPNGIERNMTEIEFQQLKSHQEDEAALDKLKGEQMRKDTNCIGRPNYANGKTGLSGRQWLKEVQNPKESG